jgi:hypothetical protein
VWLILLAGYFGRIIDMQIRSVGIDLGKTTFHLVALGDNGKVLLKKKCTQKQLITFTANLQTLLIGMEPCSGCAFPGPCVAGTGARREADSSSVREAFSKIRQERLR